ncbi:ABC transporter permease [Carnobacteriaceae bacterium zg-ZUI252]|nr:ABC transporter permease [Carnobacteriaceae bacterium zg-ZUI252]MBS4770209.1 ABC transporter permease [Carnobacteriaceae bacterium zg-ZUI240]QTU83433.1 ABC transporter permease [Carnobacteriaceae bacterium zg-C25]
MSVMSVSILILIWQACGFLNVLPQYILPTPLEIMQSIFRDYAYLLYHGQFTLFVALLGLLLGVMIAVVLSLIMDSVPLFQKAIYPFLVMTQTIPTIALAPILVLWLGYGMLPKIVLIVMTTTFPIVISILDGFRQADKDTLMLFQLMRATKQQTLVHFKIPATLPYFFAGLRVSVSYAFISAVVSEWLGGFEGLGVYMIRAKKIFQYDTMFAIIIIVSIISLLSMKAVEQLEKRVITWRR